MHLTLTMMSARGGMSPVSTSPLNSHRHYQPTHPTFILPTHVHMHAHDSLPPTHIHTHTHVHTHTHTCTYPPPHFLYSLPPSLAFQPYISHARGKAEILKRTIPSGNHRQGFVSNSRNFWQSNEMAVWQICHVTMGKARDMCAMICRSSRVET